MQPKASASTTKAANKLDKVVITNVKILILFIRYKESKSLLGDVRIDLYEA